MSSTNNHNPDSNSRTRWFYNNRFLILILLTLILMLVGSLCRIPGMIDHPQFDLPISGDLVKRVLIENNLLLWFKAFFIVDFVWAFVLLWLVRAFVGGVQKKKRPDSNLARIGMIAYTIVIVGAYLSDVIENALYLQNYSYPETMAQIKIVLYAIVFFVWVLVVLNEYFPKYYPSVVAFLKSSAYSLLIIAVIGVFLPKAPQVNSIVVQLYDRPINLFILLMFFAPIYSIMLAHYPTYFNIDERYRKWYRADYKIKTYLSTVFYKYDPDYKGSSSYVIESVVNFLLRILGIIFYVALFYLIAFTSETNFRWSIETSKIALLLLVLGIILLYYLKNEKQKWLETNLEYLNARIPFYDGDFKPKKEEIEDEKEQVKSGNSIQECIENSKTLQVISDELLEKDKEKLRTLENGLGDEAKENLKTILKPVRIYIWLLTIMLSLHLLFFIYLGYIALIKDCAECLYTQITVIWSLACIVLQMAVYIYYRSFRSVLRFVFFSEKNPTILNAFYIMRVFEVGDGEVQLTQKHIQLKKEQILKFFKLEPFGKPKGIIKLFSKFNNGFTKKGYFSFGSLSNNVIFLQFMILFGIINTLFFVVINISGNLTFSINGANVILSALFFYYGILVILTKNFIFYKYSKEKYAIRNRKKFNYYLVFTFLILFIANRMGREFPNELFTLEEIEQIQDEEVTLDTFVTQLDTIKPRYYIGSYGGGMKSNAWTLSVLNELYKNDPEFLEKAVVISGASGGTMGLINWSAIINHQKSDTLWQDAITSISTENVLSMDLTHILGRDLFNHMFVPKVDLKGKDRSSKAMNRYAVLAGETSSEPDGLSFRNYWKELYLKQDKKFPILIANTTNVLGNAGMAVSVSTQFESDEHSLLYQNSDNIVDLLQVKYDENESIPNIKKATLSYYNAASTSNRFPLISPAAKIKSLGYFNDGGIYDNSGMLSAYKLFRSINYNEKTKNFDALKQQNVFINIVNDKNAYIRHAVEKFIENHHPGAKILIKKINKNTEINAIVNSIASTEMMPIFVKSELQRLADKHSNIDFETIYLPHTFSISDIRSIYGDEIDIGLGQELTYEALYLCVKQNDTNIKNWIDPLCKADKTRIIEPPMSRALSAEAYQFMRSMLSEGTSTYKTIQEIVAIK